MALQQLRDWLLAPYYTQAAKQKSDAEYNAQNNAERPQIHRRLLVISGDVEFIENTIDVLLAELPVQCRAEAFSESQLKSKNRKMLLGSERDIAIFHCHESFNPGNFLALAGTIKHGGCLIVTCPSFDKWPQQHHASFISYGYESNDSAYLNRFITLLLDDKHTAIHSLEGTRLPNQDIPYLDAKQDMGYLETYQDSQHLTPSLFSSKDQRAAFNALSAQFKEDNLHTILAAPRGRGKSSLLGIFIWHLLNEGQHILLTSTLFENVHAVFRQIDRMCEQNKTSTDDSKDPHVESFSSSDKNLNKVLNKTPEKKRCVGEGTVEWVAPDNPVLSSGHCNIVFIDEAASLPIPVVLNIITNHKQWLLSTTLQGYEGSGSGFIHKLIPKLHAHSNESEGKSVNIVELHTPLRWLHHDPIERFITKACLFDTGAENSESFLGCDKEDSDKTVEAQLVPTNSFSDTSLSKTRFQRLSETALGDVMKLLTLAHYQTTPDDLMRLLDSPDLIVFLLYQDAKVIGAAVVNEEGGEKLKDIAENIATGERRPKGHLGAQQLTLMSANPTLATLKYWRINRIAVCPELQGKGFGTSILTSIEKAAKEADIDSLSTSYGSEDKLDRFWQHNEFVCVHKGEKANKASGETSVLRIAPLSDRARTLSSELASIYDAKNKQTTYDSLSASLQLLCITKLRHFIAGYRSLDNIWGEINAIVLCCTEYPESYLSAPLHDIDTATLDELSAQAVSANKLTDIESNADTQSQDLLNKNTLDKSTLSKSTLTRRTPKRDQQKTRSTSDSFFDALFTAIGEFTGNQANEVQSELIKLLQQPRPNYDSLSNTLKTKGKKGTTAALKEIISRFIIRLEMAD
ncbi:MULTISPECIES: GNAT family N-acetyltransferase [unclassified Alteromonas]|uniref:GNAT family N-acetyltransferase n=1 Tax=unclassified Alteromonas TaxID=2614992 RepID=UPI00068FF40E|nr:MULTISPECIES: GNAT family N-acetyltransferase [unclassified Alteromonas]